MRTSQSFADALTPQEARRALPTLERAIEQFEPGKWALVGSWATNFWLATHEVDPLPRRRAEMDIVSLDLDTVSPNEQRYFAFAHLHQATDQAPHYAALVSRATGVKIDAFAPRIWPGRMPTFEDIPLTPDSGLVVPVIKPVEQLVASVDDVTSRIMSSTAFGSHDKFFTAIHALNKIVGREKAELAWDLLKKDRKCRLDMSGTIAWAQKEAHIQGKPPISKARHIVRKLTQQCVECDPVYNDKTIPLISDRRAALSMLTGRGPY